MVRRRPPWHAMLPGGSISSAFSLDELRAAERAHAFLTEKVAAPEAIASCVRGFRYLLAFGVACVAENKFPPLSRCWKDLEARFTRDPGFDDDLLVQSWMLIDFPFGPSRQTALDYFEEFVDETEQGPQLSAFIAAARASRLGLHQDVMRTKKVAKFRELFTGNVIEAFPSVDDYGKGEILLTRAMACDSQVFLFGNPKGFPRQAKQQIEDMILDKLFYLEGDLDETQPIAAYETFMKLAGPYWMSCVTKNEDAPILSPDHYRTYLERRA